MLHGLADRLLDELMRDYQVDRFEGAALDPRLLGNGDQSERLVRLVPSTGRGAPLTVDFMVFPGLYVRFGRWHIQMFPSCGCDYCDEDPEGLGEDFADRVRVLVAGGFEERRDYAGFRSADWSSSHSSVSVEPELPSHDPGLPEPPAVGWGPWVRRPATAAL